MAGVSDLNAHTGYLLRMVSNAVSQEFARKVASEDVTVAEWVMLRSLYGSDAMAPSALSRPIQAWMAASSITGCRAKLSRVARRRRGSLRLTSR